MKKWLFPLSVVLLFITACQKEVSFEDDGAGQGGGGGSTAPTGLLTRTVFVSGADSVASNFGYDASRRLITFSSVNTGGGNQSQRIVRNATGIITKYVTKSDDLASIGIDSLETFVTYDASQSRYKSASSSVTIGGTTYTDSTAYTYDGTGNLTVKTSHALAGPGLYIPYSKIEYTHASGNVTSEKYFSANATSGWDLDRTYTYTYDNKLNPVKLGPEAMIVLDDGSFFSTNNVATMTYADADPSFNYVLATTYTYNSANKPSGGTAVETPGSGTHTIRYYYN